MSKGNNDLREAVEDLLDKHAEYYIKQTVKFFQRTGESPALSKNNLGDIRAKAAIEALLKADRQRLLNKLLAEMPERKPITWNSAQGQIKAWKNEGFNQALDQCKQIIEDMK